MKREQGRVNRKQVSCPKDRFTVCRLRFKSTKLRVCLRCYRVPEAVEPCARVEVLPVLAHICNDRTVSVPHNHQSEGRLVLQKTLRPVPL